MKCLNFLILFLMFQYVNAQKKELIEISESYVASFVKTKNATATIAENSSMLLEMQKHNPLVELNAPKGSWDISNNTSISFQVRNVGDTEIALNCHIDEHQWCEGLLLLSPGESGTMSVLVKGYALPENHQLALNYKDMRGLPGGYLQHWVKLDAANVKKLRLSLVNPNAGAKITIGNIIACGDLNEKSGDEIKASFPFVDKYGQYMHKSWTGKITSDDGLRAQIQTESKDLDAFPTAANRNKYGGWTKEKKRKATGHFRTEKIDGKWWLIDPDGYLFWSHGITGVGKGAATTKVTDREHYFSALPKHNSPQFQFAQTNSEGKINTFNFTASNLYLKYGKDWKNIYQQSAHKRLKSWGMNTIGNWSDTDTYMLRKTPYTVSVSFPWERVGGKLKFPNVYHPDYNARLKKAFEIHKETWNDPWCIGYFVDNELHGWGAIGRHVLMSPATDQAKVELVNFLKRKYIQIVHLNSAWKTFYESWGALLDATENVQGKTVSEDLLEFEQIMVDLYYKTCNEVLKEKAPNKLYLGSRLHNHYYPEDLGHQRWIVSITAKYCDVISFNRYRFAPNDLQPHDKSIDKPIIIGEFHFGALDRGMLHTGLRSVQNQEQRGRAYYKYIRAAVENPYLVGAHWFQYGEQAVTGRFDGENYQIGFLDVCDTPYQETIDGCRKISDQMYELRFANKQ